MPHEYWMYILIVAFAGILSLFSSIYALLRVREAPGGKYFILLGFMSSLFTFAYAFELSSNTLDQIKFWLKVEYLGLPYIPVFLLFMCFDFVGQKINKWIYYVLYTTPILTILIHFTNDYHHFYYTSINLKDSGPFTVIDLEKGPWFYVHSIFMYASVLISMGILLKQLNEKSLLKFRMQIGLLVAGLAIPIVGSIFYLSGLSPYGIDLGPVSMSITYVFFCAALLKYQMFNVAPIVRDKVFESMKEGILVVDPNDVVVDYNNAMTSVFPTLNQQMIGESVTCVLPENKQLYDVLRERLSTDIEISLKGRPSHFQISFSPIHTKNGVHIGQIISFFNVTERVELQKKLNYLASIDGLTQVYNRSFFIKESENLFDSTSNEGGYMSVIMFDIDRFKNVNDQFGHQAGDYVIREVVDIAKASLRQQDIIGRYGGEEFIICLPNTTLGTATDVAESIRKKIAENELVVSGNYIPISSSFGVSSVYLQPDTNIHTIHSLMRQADKALYVAKENGRNRVETFDREYEYAT
ncbi:histidine kinase N-terminal 7TM domain-containing protein [Fredinandcohnia humi]